MKELNPEASCLKISGHEVAQLAVTLRNIGTITGSIPDEILQEFF
jgi:hypothetical protein